MLAVRRKLQQLLSGTREAISIARIADIRFVCRAMLLRAIEKVSIASSSCGAIATCTQHLIDQRANTKAPSTTIPR